MPTIAIVGAQWGDEGKGKVVDLLAQQADMVVRFSGGNNAGHTVLNDRGEFRLHLVPAGVFNPKCTCVIGNGVVIDPAALKEELDVLHTKGVDTGHVFISDRAHVVMPYHVQLDALEEEARGANAVGTTRRGIGPVFVDKVNRLGIRTGDLLDKKSLLERLQFVVEQKNRLLTQLYGAKPLELEDIYQYCLSQAELLKDRIRQTEHLVREAIAVGKRVLLEGAQGTLLDVDFGTYPYVTSSNTIAEGIYTGAGISPQRLRRVVGVFKAYTTRVGAGPMPTELMDGTGEAIRQRAGEYGATTGRPRRCGWFDAVVARYSTQLNGFTFGALTRLDVLDSFSSIKVCAAYQVNGRTYELPPTSAAELARCTPVYEELPGWETDTGKVREFSQLPKGAKRYVRRLEDMVGCPMGIVSVGAERDSTIIRRKLW